ncbi:MAG: hypothetical protein ACI4PQ_04795 [Butyricicoccaceae bacterium]
MKFSLFARETRTSFPLLLVFAVLLGGASYQLLSRQLVTYPFVVYQSAVVGITNDSLVLFTAVQILLALLFTIILSNRLVPHQIANRRMSYLLAAPNSRRSIVATKRFVVAFQTLVLVLISSAVYGWLITRFAPEAFDGRRLALAGLGAYLLVYALSGLVFLFACCFRRSLPSVVLSILFCAVFCVLHVLAAQGGSLAYCLYATPLSLLDLSEVFAGNMIALLKLIGLFAMGLICQSIGYTVFKRKNFEL